MKRVRGQTLARILFGLASGEEEYVKRFARRRILAPHHSGDLCGFLEKSTRAV